MSSDKKSKSYPRAIPHRPPEEPAPVAVRDRRPEETPALPDRGRQFLLAGAVCLLAAVAIGTPLCWDRIRPSVAQADMPAAPVAVVPADPPAPVPVAAAVAKPKQDAESVATATKTAAVPTVAKERYLEALGSLTAVHLYQSYLNIGLLADAAENEQMDHADAEKTLEQIVRLMTLVDRQLEAIARTGLDHDDQQAMQNIRKLTATLQTQADALRAYWDTGEPEQAARFHDSRTQAWSGISEMLGLEAMDDR